MPSTPTDMARDEACRLLHGCDLFRTLEEEPLRQLALQARRRRFVAGQTIFRLGEAGDSMMVVLLGTVRITVPSPDGKEMVLAELGAGQVIGEIALLDGKERSADAAALTNCDLLVLERRDMLHFLEQHPRVSQALLETLCARLRRADEQIGEFAFLGLPARLAKTLLRAAAPPGRARPAKLALSQRELGTMIGATRESVNRCLREWHRRGFIRLEEGWITILAAAALEEIGGGGSG